MFLKYTCYLTNLSISDMLLFLFIFQVTKSFFYLLLVYIFFILSFALGFYVLFNKEFNVNPEKKGTSTKKNDYQYFNTTWQTFVKASTMFTGEQVSKNSIWDKSLLDYKFQLQDIGYFKYKYILNTIYRSLVTFLSTMTTFTHLSPTYSFFHSYSSLLWYS